MVKGATVAIYVIDDHVLTARFGFIASLVLCDGLRATLIKRAVVKVLGDHGGFVPEGTFVLSHTFGWLRFAIDHGDGRYSVEQHWIHV